MSIARATIYDKVLSEEDIQIVLDEFCIHFVDVDDLKFLIPNPGGWEALPNFIEPFVKINRVSKKTYINPDKRYSNQSGNIIELPKGITAARRYYNKETAICTTTFLDSNTELVFKDIDLNVKASPGRTVVFFSDLKHEYRSDDRTHIMIANYEEHTI